ncbi:hypothetical protein [Synechococcus sp. CBW1108]|uniref:hypothetical protein n=1 Tax=Synechococcus sp. CBW1108 TaxID=1353147 RepID=UPI0018CEC89F|nr:hypothetical protein [Synechococcus sp. CBW1108]QPN69292.1 hypothetical protein H8F27_11840 [Synechococcus sp. CBW1108]
MPTDFSAIDLGTINAAHEVIVASIRHKVCEWEQKSSDLATDGNLTNAVMVKHWAFAADLLSTTISTEFTNLFSKALNARFGDLTHTTHRSVADQVLDAVALEVAAAQEVPELVAV